MSLLVYLHCPPTHQLSKESRQALQSLSSDKAGAAAAVTDDYAQLDRSARASDAYLARRSAELDATLEELRQAVAAKEEESDRLQVEVEAMEAEAERGRDEVREMEESLLELQGGDGSQHQGAARARQRNLLQQKIQEQHELILSLQEQLDTYIYRSFPSLG